MCDLLYYEIKLSIHSLHGFLLEHIPPYVLLICSSVLSLPWSKLSLTVYWTWNSSSAIHLHESSVLAHMRSGIKMFTLYLHREWFSNNKAGFMCRSFILWFSRVLCFHSSKVSSPMSSSEFFPCGCSILPFFYYTLHSIL